MPSEQMTVEDIRAACESVLARYARDHACPCKVPEFVYWVSKPQGPGWMDDIQNELVCATYRLPFFRQEGVAEPVPMTDVRPYTCGRCGRQWPHTQFEWRMLAFWERLLPVDGQVPPPERYSGSIGASLFGTVGYEPRGVPQLSLEEWKRFMLGSAAR